jgi:hypothetical protein
VIIQKLKTAVEFEQEGRLRNDGDGDSAFFVRLAAKVEVRSMHEGRELARKFEQWLKDQSLEGKQYAPSHVGMSERQLQDANAKKLPVKYWPSIQTACVPIVGLITGTNMAEAIGTGRVHITGLLRAEGYKPTWVPASQCELAAEKPALPEEVTP